MRIGLVLARTKMWKSYFWMAHYGGNSPKRQVVWSNEKRLVAQLAWSPKTSRTASVATWLNKSKVPIQSNYTTIRLVEICCQLAKGKPKGFLAFTQVTGPLTQESRSHCTAQPTRTLQYKVEFAYQPTFLRFAR